jgi:fructose-bisphosphate aldolase class II
MPLVSGKELLIEARRGRYAVGAFNANNLEMIQGIIGAAEEERAPVILQASQGAIKYAGLEYITEMVKVAGRLARIPVVLHLDHGTDFSQAVLCLRAGFTSLMFDGSLLPYEENVRITKSIVEIAQPCGVSVEGEIGRIGGAEEGDASESRPVLTDPREAQSFVEDTGIDSVAVAVGTVHKMKVKEARLDLELLEKIAAQVKIPLVLHGSSGVPDEALREAVKRGISKVNVATELSMGFSNELRKTLTRLPDEVDTRSLLKPAREALKQVVRRKIKVLGSSGKG